MAYIVLAIVLTLLAIFLIFIKSEKLDRANKITIFILGSTLILSIVIYQLNFNKNSNMHREIINAYTQGKTLLCKEYEVNQESFIFFGGTNTFVARDKNSALAGVIVSIKDCRVQ